MQNESAVELGADESEKAEEIEELEIGSEELQPASNLKIDL
jgi:hypothetical protein